MNAQVQIIRDVVPWLSDFCAAHDFTNPGGQTNVARALNMLTGHEPRTNAERAFLGALWTEVERRRIVVPMTDAPPLTGPHRGGTAMTRPRFRLAGMIGEGEATARALGDFLSDNAGRPVVLTINSPGGDAFEGAAMLAEVERHGNVTSMGEGIVASAATLPLMAAREIVLHREAAIMIHDPSGFSFGPSGVHRATADVLDKLGGVYADFYARASGTPVQVVAAWMRAETWMTAEEAVALHFADRIEGDDRPVSVAAFDFTRFTNPPAALVKMARANGWAAVPSETSTERKTDA